MDNFDPSNIDDIESKRRRATQKTAEKVAIAEQTLEQVSSRLQKLDNDLNLFETFLRLFTMYPVQGMISLNMT